MAVSEGSKDLEQWLVGVYSPSPVPHDEVNADTLAWLAEYFDSHGPVTQQAAWAALLAEEIALANEAAVAVLHDLHQATSLRPEVVVDAWSICSVRISIDGGFQAPSIWALDRPGVFAEVADYFQEWLYRPEGLWPLCPDHNFGLHAEVQDGIAVWRCRPHRHSIAAIGALGK